VVGERAGGRHRTRNGCGVLWFGWGMGGPRRTQCRGISTGSESGARVGSAVLFSRRWANCRQDMHPNLPRVSRFGLHSSNNGPGCRAAARVQRQQFMARFAGATRVPGLGHKQTSLPAAVPCRFPAPRGVSTAALPQTCGPLWDTRHRKTVEDPVKIAAIRIWAFADHYLTTRYKVSAARLRSPAHLPRTTAAAAFGRLVSTSADSSYPPPCHAAGRRNTLRAYCVQ
jgi:hypothetical protein